MNENLDLTKILKDCPIYGLGILTKVTNRIHVKFPKEHNVKCFRPDGKVSEEGEIMLFPKGKTTWEGFQKTFVDGDVVYAKVDGTPYIIIYQKQIDERVYRHACLCLEIDMFGCDKDCIFTDDPIDEWRLATKEEKQKLFDAIKANGYKWNAETKTLEKFIKPKFKVGDKIRHQRDLSKSKHIITEIRDIDYILDNEMSLPFTCQESYELVPNKFDPKNLKPFDKVLVRNVRTGAWVCAFFSHIEDTETYRYFATITIWRYCIPYNDATKHLVGKSEDAPEFYRYWEE